MVGFGFGLERVVLRPLLGRPVVAVIMATIGLAAVLRGVAPIVFGAETRALPLPIGDDPITIGPATPAADPGARRRGGDPAVPRRFSWFFKKSRMGVAMRAVADNQQVAQAMGINVERYFALAWAMAGIVVGAGRHRLGQHAGRRRAARAGRPQGVPGGDPGRPRFDRRRAWSAG